MSHGANSAHERAGAWIVQADTRDAPIRRNFSGHKSRQRQGPAGYGRDHQGRVMMMRE
jgi:hypothetical protein